MLDDKFFKKLALYMSYEVPEDEKHKAEKIVNCLDALKKTITSCNDHLDLIYTPFKDNQNISSDQVYKARAALRRYRDKAADNFNVFKRKAFRCFVAMQPFASDTQMVKLQKSFVLSMGDVEKQVNRLIELFSDLKSNDFPKAVVGAIDNIKKEMAQLEQIIDDRVRSHIQDNILATNWVDIVSKELNEKVEKRVPDSIKMYEKRQGQADDKQ